MGLLLRNAAFGNELLLLYMKYNSSIAVKNVQQVRGVYSHPDSFQLFGSPTASIIAMLSRDDIAEPFIGTPSCMFFTRHTQLAILPALRTLLGICSMLVRAVYSYHTSYEIKTRKNLFCGQLRAA